MMTTERFSPNLIQWQGALYTWINPNLYKFEIGNEDGWVVVEALPSDLVRTDAGIFPTASETGKIWLSKQQEQKSEPHKCRCPKDRPLLWYGCQCGGV